MLSRGDGDFFEKNLLPKRRSKRFPFFCGLILHAPVEFGKFPPCHVILCSDRPQTKRHKILV